MCLSYKSAGMWGRTIPPNKQLTVHVFFSGTFFGNLQPTRFRSKGLHMCSALITLHKSHTGKRFTDDSEYNPKWRLEINHFKVFL